MIVFLDGQLIPAQQARVSVFDRGFLFGDGVYEGLRATRGHIIALDRHVSRMAAGLAETRIRGFDPERLGDLSRSLLEANTLSSAFVYWQVTRGTPADGAARTRVPPADTPPTVLGFVTPMPPLDECIEPVTMRVALRPDTRWQRGHVKSISLLGNVLAAIEAKEQNLDDAILHRDGVITEASATNVMVVLDGQIITPDIEQAQILRGVTRDLLLEADPSIIQRPVSTEELARAQEVILVGTRTLVASVVEIDRRPVGDGQAGPVARRLLRLLVDAASAPNSEATHV